MKSGLLTSDNESWHTEMGRIWPRFMPMPLHADDNHPCSFSAIFADPFAASFYSLTWSEVGNCWPSRLVYVGL